jgi:co-chaperonin GroES (HSP10)
MMKPLHQNVLVKKILGDKITTSGLVLPNYNAYDNESKVLAVGPDVTEVKVGDVVYVDPHPRHKIHKVSYDELILHAEDLMAVNEEI